MGMSPQEVRRLVDKDLFPQLTRERERLDRIDRWYRWDPDKPHQPRHASREYQGLMDRSQTRWLGLVVTVVAQNLYVEGYRAKGQDDDAAAWGAWQANRMDARQIPVHRAALAYGIAYGTVLPGTDPITREPMPVMRGVSPRRMIALYDDPVDDEFPVAALRVDPAMVDGSLGWRMRVYDDEIVHHLTAGGGGDNLRYRREEGHDVGVCPVTRFTNEMDLEGRADGEVEPNIAVAARINQTTFDRLVVQRFASWVVRTIAGMTKPPSVKSDSTDAEVAAAIEAAKLRLSIDGILVAEDPDTKFGSLPATALDGFINARDADIRDLAAVTQTPPHHLLGTMANLSAEALAAAEAGNNRKTEERKHTLGESWEQELRLVAHVMGDEAGARDVTAQVRWRDMESRSLAQVADALGKLAQMLGVPPQALWERVPGVTQQDVENWKALAAENDQLGQLAAEIERQMTTGLAEPPVPEPSGSNTGG